MSERFDAAAARPVAHVTGFARPAAASRTLRSVRRLGAKRPSRAARASSAFAAPNDPLWPETWALTKIGAPRAWQRSRGTREMVVAVIDTGIDAGHPDLAGALVPGYDFVNGDADPADDHGHGTLVAGAIAARTNNGLGVASGCWECSIMPMKAIGADGLGYADPIAAAIRWAADNGADLINMSFAMSSPDPKVAAAVEHAATRGVLLVAAAGNDGNTERRWPAAFPRVLSVAGTDEADAVYGWSTRGAWVAVGAPGCTPTTVAGGSYGVFCGTSAAAANVAGMLALARSAAAAKGPDAVTAAAAGTAVKVGGFVAHGRLDAGALVDELAGPAGSRYESDAELVRRGVGTARRDVVVGSARRDVVRTAGGNDVVRLGTGNDVVDGGRGRDLLYGGRGADKLSGGRGRDRIHGGRGRDRLQGGRGSDLLLTRDGRRDVVRCGSGHDVVVADARDRVAAGCEIVRRRAR